LALDRVDGPFVLPVVRRMIFAAMLAAGSVLVLLLAALKAIDTGDRRRFGPAVSRSGIGFRLWERR
jgi:hypothetical protein